MAMKTVGSLKQQRGMAAFAVTTALILVISLIVLGFSLVSRRSQQQTLDRQLGQQAIAAAESGANMAAAIIQKQLASGISPTALPEKTTCQDYATYPELRLDGDNVKVTCLLVHRDTDSLSYANITEGSPTVVPLTTDSTLGEVTITWRNNEGVADASGCSSNGHSRPQKNAWQCNFGLLRIDIAPVSNGNATVFAKTAFIYPYRDLAPATPSTPSYAVGALNGSFIDAACSGGQCRVKITGIAGAEYFMAVRSLYKDSDLSVTGVNTLGGAVTFNGQAVVDSTGKAGDVVKRIQVRVPLEAGSAGVAPGYVVESEGSLCKKFSVAPSYYNSHGVSCRTD